MFLCCRWRSWWAHNERTRAKKTSLRLSFVWTITQVYHVQLEGLPLDCIATHMNWPDDIRSYFKIAILQPKICDFMSERAV